MTNSTSLHENSEDLAPATIDRHRAISSIMEELEAVDWYDQRMETATDPELRRILAHNRDEEKEHAAMVIEWLRRNDDAFDRHLRTYLFSERSIVELEVEDTESDTRPDDSASSLRIGGLQDGSK